MKVLADNLNRLIGPGKKFASNEAVAAASGVGRSTIDRARKSEVSLRLDNVTELARAANIEPWELLYPNVDPENRPKIVSTDPDDNWPLPGVSPGDFNRIPPDEIEEVLTLIRSKVSRHVHGLSKSAGPKKAA